ncbi:MAG: hypothetical protein AAF589_00380 [Planctomycetota bacterium]
MDSLNNLIRQVRELFESMTPGARLTAGLLMAVVLVSVGLLFQQSTAGPDEYLFGAEPLSGRQVNAITAAMAKAGLNGFEVEGSRVRVPRGERHAYIAAVADAGALPLGAKDFMAKALSEASPWGSESEKKQRVKLALEEELSHVIGWFPWVQQASVIYDIKSVRGPRPKEVGSATVSVMPMLGETIDGRRVRNIQKLVAGGFTSMSPEDVQVNNLGGEDASGSMGDDIDAAMYETPYHRERARVVNETRRNILQQLNYIPGVRVQVSAVLDPTVTTRVTGSKPDQQAVAQMEETTREETTESTEDNAARPGLTVQGPRGVGNDDTPQRKNSRSTVVETGVTNSVVGEEKKEEVRIGMAAKEIQASVEVPRDYVINVWRQEQVLLTGEAPTEIEATGLKSTEDEIVRRVQRAVKPLLPQQFAEDDYERVSVVVIDTITSEPLPEISLASNALEWTSRNGRTLAMLGVAVFSMLMLRSFVRGGAEGDPDAAATPVLQLGPGGEVAVAPATGGANAEDDDEEEVGPRLKFRKADSLTNDLAEIVRGDPDAAAAILRSWIGKAS